MYTVEITHPTHSFNTPHPHSPLSGPSLDKTTAPVTCVAFRDTLKEDFQKKSEIPMLLKQLARDS